MAFSPLCSFCPLACLPSGSFVHLACSPLADSPPGSFAPCAWLICPWLVRPLADSPPGLFAPWFFRPLTLDVLPSLNTDNSTLRFRQFMHDDENKPLCECLMLCLILK